MSSPLIDIEELLKPIPGEAPAGQPLPDVLRMQLDDLRKEPDALDPTTANRKSDWPQIQRLATDALLNNSKDLIVAVRLMEAITKKDGAKGLQEGLTLVLRLIRDCSDRLHPIPQEGEGFDIWEGAMKWINDSTRGGQFPATVTRVPIVTLNNNPYSYEDWIRPDRKPEFEEALSALKPEPLRAAYQQWLSIRTTLQELARVLDDRLGAEIAPDMLSDETSGNIGNAVSRCIELIEEISKRKSIPLVDTPASPSTDSSEGGTESSSGGSNSVGISSSREGLYRQLSDIAASLERIEPHSPIPMLLRRCVRLGAMPFPQLIREIVRDSSTLDELDRLLDVK